MSRRKRLAQGAAVALGTGIAAYGAARFAARRARRRDDPHAGRDFEPPFDVEREIVTADGARLHLIERGEGIPIVLAHGVTNDHRSWFHQVEDLPAQGFRVVAFDQRGHGQSTVGESGFGIAPLADDLREVLEQLDLRDAVIVGHSMGGMGAQAFACHHPDVARERVAGLVLVGTTSHALRMWRSVDRVPDRFSIVTDEWFSRLMVHDDLGYLATRLGLGRSPHTSHVELVRRMVVECPSETRRLATRALLDYDVHDLLCDVGLPALVLCGTLDLLAPAAASRRIVAALPRAELRLIPGAGHMPHLEFADEVTKAIADFAGDVTAATEGVRPSSTNAG